MTRFFLNDKEKLETAIKGITRALEKFNARDFDADTALLAALNNAIDVYKVLGKSNRESGFQSLKAEWVTAQRGINPITFEKVTIRKNEMLNGISFKVLQRAEQQLGDDLQEVDNAIKDAQTLISQIVIAGVQTGILPKAIQAPKPAKGKKTAAPPSSEQVWTALSADANISLGQKRVQLVVNKYDALIILEDMLKHIQ